MSAHNKREFVSNTKKVVSAPVKGEKKPQKVGFLARMQGKPAYTYLFGFLAIWSLLCILYGDVLYRTEQESFVALDAALMKPVTDMEFGNWYFAGRLALSLFSCRWIGGTLLALMLTAIVWLINYVCRIPSRLWSIAWLVPLGFFAWYVQLGYHIFFEVEPSVFLLVPMLTFMALALVALPVSFLLRQPFRKGEKTKNRLTLALLLLVVAGVAGCICGLQGFTFLVLFFSAFALCTGAFLLELLWSEKPKTSGKHSVSFGLLAIILVTAGAWYAASYINDNEITSCRQQNRMMEGDWQGMIEDGLAARQPNRTVAAYYAIGLVFTDQILDRLFQIPFHYPDVRLNERSKNDEYGLLLPDCNYAAGLLNPAYHSAFEHVVSNGLRLRHLKRMAICSILNDEPLLAKKYMRILSLVPFEKAFVEKYEPMIENRDLIKEDPELSHVMSLYPHESRFEQYYRQPTFMGYNMGLLSGSDATLITSAAATLYSKDLRSFMLRAMAFQQKGWPLPQCMQEAIVLYDMTNPNDHALDRFKGSVSDYVMTQVQAFATAAKAYVGDKDAMRDNLRQNWLGSYFYYYYCENNNPNQVAKSSSNSGVN